MANKNGTQISRVQVSAQQAEAIEAYRNINPSDITTIIYANKVMTDSRIDANDATRAIMLGYDVIIEGKR